MFQCVFHRFLKVAFFRFQLCFEMEIVVEHDLREKTSDLPRWVNKLVYPKRRAFLDHKITTKKVATIPQYAESGNLENTETTWFHKLIFWRVYSLAILIVSRDFLASDRNGCTFEGYVFILSISWPIFPLRAPLPATPLCKFSEFLQIWCLAHFLNKTSHSSGVSVLSRYGSVLTDYIFRFPSKTHFGSPGPSKSL